MAIGGQSSGDNRLSNSALRILYSVVKDTIPALASDAFLQSNPVSADHASATWPVGVKKGVLGGTVAFLRPDAGNNVVGGPGPVATTVDPTVSTGGWMRPLGLFVNDAVGNAFENTAAVASGKLAVLRGGSVGVKLYETKQLTGGDAGDALNWKVGDHVYGSKNGLLTNRWEDSLEWAQAQGGDNDVDPVSARITRMGVVVAAPDATSAELFVALSF
jgi:hypothetical protein